VTSSLDGLDLGALDKHLRSIGVQRTGELQAELISGGRSNLTFLVFDDTSKWVLRRPPLHGLTPSAHDMAREYKVVAALEDTPVPVAHAVTMRNDDSVLGAPFQMVEYVPGRVVRYAEELEALGDQTVIDGCVDALIKVLAMNRGFDGGPNQMPVYPMRVPRNAIFPELSSMALSLKSPVVTNWRLSGAPANRAPWELESRKATIT